MADDVGELEHCFGEAFREGEHRAALRFGNESEGHGEEDAEDDDLQDLVLGNGFGDVFGEDVDDELCGSVRGGVERFGSGGGREADAFAGAADVDGGETDEQRDGGDDFEIDQGLEAETADALEVSMACDADD